MIQTSAKKIEKNVAPWRTLFDIACAENVLPSTPTKLTREGYFDDFAKTGMPTLKNERWHFTNLRPLITQEFTIQATPTLKINMPADVQRCKETPQHIPTTPLHHLGLAFVQESHHFYVNENTHITQPLTLSTYICGTQTVHHNHTLYVGQGSEITLIEHQHSGLKSTGWLNTHFTINIQKNATVRHIILQDQTQETFHTGTTQITVEKGAAYHAFVLHVGGKLARHETHVTLNGQHANAYVNGLSLATKNQLLDHDVRITHTAPNCQSKVMQRNVATGSAHTVFQGAFYVKQKAQLTDAQMLCQNLLLSDKAKTSHKPELEIFADDVKCSHGATTGSLDKEALFYLQSRGISKKQAQKMLVEAFLDKSTENVSDEKTHKIISDRIKLWLNQ